MEFLINPIAPTSSTTPCNGLHPEGPGSPPPRPPVGGGGDGNVCAALVIIVN